MSAQDVFVIVHCPSPPYCVEGGDFRDSVKTAVLAHRTKVQPKALSQ